MSTQTQNRQPSGVPTGGQFAAEQRASADISLAANQVEPLPAIEVADLLKRQDEVWSKLAAAGEADRAFDRIFMASAAAELHDEHQVTGFRAYIIVDSDGEHPALEHVTTADGVVHDDDELFDRAQDILQFDGLLRPEMITDDDDDGQNFDVRELVTGVEADAAKVRDYLVGDENPMRRSMKAAFADSSSSLEQMPALPEGLASPHIATALDEDGIQVSLDFEVDGEEHSVTGWRSGGVGDFETTWSNGEPAPEKLTIEQMTGISAYLRAAHANASILQGVVESQLTEAKVYEAMGDALNRKAGLS